MGLRKHLSMLVPRRVQATTDSIGASFNIDPSRQSQQRRSKQLTLPCLGDSLHATSSGVGDRGR